MIDYVDIVARESARFAEAAQIGDLEARVPSCPDWNLADLIWHLAEVQDFWGAIVGDLLASPDEYVQPERPADPDLVSLFVDRSDRLVRVLGDRSPDDECWSWHPQGKTVGWIRWRQAHEALIHRVDAELTIGEVTSIEPDVAADGVGEMLHNQIDSPLPDWAEFASDNLRAVIRTTDIPRTWGVEFGRFKGTSPDSGTAYDLNTLKVIDPPDEPEAEVSGSAADMDLWLWGRASLDRLSVSGDAALIDRLRIVAAESTN